MVPSADLPLTDQGFDRRLVQTRCVPSWTRPPRRITKADDLVDALIRLSQLPADSFSTRRPTPAGLPNPASSEVCSHMCSSVPPAVAAAKVVRVGVGWQVSGERERESAYDRRAQNTTPRAGRHRRPEAESATNAGGPPKDPEIASRCSEGRQKAGRSTPTTDPVEVGRWPRQKVRRSRRPTASS
jgi:hypothetical protein